VAREDAERQLENLSQQNFPQYMAMLITELANESNNADIRSAAGIAFKNCLAAKDDATKAGNAQRWLQIDPHLREQLKGGLLGTLPSTSSKAGLAAARAVAAVAEIEIPNHQWLNVVGILCESVKHNDPNLKEASLKALGFICEAVVNLTDELEREANNILTAVAHGARKDEPESRVRLAAIKALTNSLEFVKNNFELEVDRNYIMVIVCEGTVCDDDEVKKAAFECLVKIVQLYYDKMQIYMDKALNDLTLQYMRHANTEVALQCVEFWSTICETELSIKNEVDVHGYSNSYNFNFVQAVHDKLILTLLFLMTRKVEDEDDDEWSISLAAATCLSLVASVIGDAVFDQVIPWIEQHLQSQDWHYREAAVMAFGSIVEGPSPDRINFFIANSLTAFISMLQDSNLQVKDSTAWTLGRISQAIAPSAIRPEQLNSLISAIVNGLNEDSKVASHCAWCIINLAERLGGGDERDGPTSKLSPYFENLISVLLAYVNEKPNLDSNLKSTVFEAIAALVNNCANDCLPFTETLATKMIQILQESLQRESVNSDDKYAIQELQSNACSVLTNIVRRLGPRIRPATEPLILSLLAVLEATSKNSTVVEDVFIVLSALTSAIEGDFIHFVTRVNQHLLAALQNPQDSQLSAIAIGLVGDICRALDESVSDFCNDYMTYLFMNLQSALLDKSVKPSILSCVGDIALAIGGNFEVYVPATMTALTEVEKVAASMPSNMPNYEQIDFINSLREGTIEAYVGITQGLGAQKANLIAPYVDRMFTFMGVIVEDSLYKESNTLPLAIAGLIGDIAEAFKEQPGMINQATFRQGWIDSLLKDLKEIGKFNAKATELAKWVKLCVKRYRQ
ncbi:karyopherin beta, partial [Blyttiomyces sp. JEL0837]